MCKPERVEWADGTAAEYDRLIRVMADGSDGRWRHGDPTSPDDTLED